jgi:hypothetical protein
MSITYHRCYLVIIDMSITTQVLLERILSDECSHFVDNVYPCLIARRQMHQYLSPNGFPEVMDFGYCTNENLPAALFKRITAAKTLAIAPL